MHPAGLLARNLSGLSEPSHADKNRETVYALEERDKAAEHSGYC
jgi:hypothetical protein